MRTNGKCNKVSRPLKLATAVFCFPSKVNIPEGPEYEKNIKHKFDHLHKETTTAVATSN